MCLEEIVLLALIHYRTNCKIKLLVIRVVDHQTVENARTDSKKCQFSKVSYNLLSVYQVNYKFSSRVYNFMNTTK